MAIFHLSVKAISRSSGRSATAAAAYRAATRVEDERTGLVHDYSRKLGVLHREIVAPEDAPAWAHDRSQLWNAAELAETRKNSTVAREIEVALPSEISPQQQRDLACTLAHEIAARHRCAVDIAIHAPARRGDERNHHAHLLMTTRRLEAQGFTEKTRELDDLKSGEVTRWRERWASLVNERLEEHGVDARIDHRSLEAQGEVREPTYHKGPAVTAIERRGEQARVSERIHEDIGERLKIAAELGRLERESNELARSIVDTTTELKAAIATRDAEHAPTRVEPAHPTKRSMDDIRRDAQTQWLALIAEQGRAERQAQLRDAVPALDRTGNLAAATASRTTTAETTTREHARAGGLIHHEQHSPSRDDDRDATTPEKGRMATTHPDDDLAQ